MLNEPKLPLINFLTQCLKMIFIRENIKVSVKTRVGVETDTAFPEIIDIYNKYPLEGNL